MGVVYQLTFFLAVALLAIVITIFVFAVSLLGRAMEAAATSERGKLTERKENNTKEMAAIRKEIEEAEASGQIPKGLTRKLEKLEKRDREFDKELSIIRKAPELLTVKGGVVPSASWLLGALILSGVAWYLSNIQIFIWIIPVLVWVVSFAAIGYSISRIYQSLKVIESVAITSEEEAERRLAAAVKVAMKEVEEEKKPKLGLKFYGEELPLRMKSNSEKEVEVRLKIVQGDESIGTLLYFAAPPGFDFPGEKTYTQDAGHPTVPNYVTLSMQLPNIKRGLDQPVQFTIKAPPRKGSFDLCYRIVCSGFDSGENWFKVVVK